MSDLERSALRAARRSGHLGAPESADGQEDGWLITYLDVITLLLVMFVVMLALSGGPSGMPGTDETVETETSPPVSAAEPPPEPERTSELRASDEASDPMAGFAEQAVQFLQEAGLGDQVDVIRQEGGISLRIGSEILFPSGTAELSNDGLAQLEQLAPLLARNDFQVVVAGHTDNRPIRSSRYPSNWELSAARAGSVVRAFLTEGIEPERLQATGFADTRPLARNDTARGRERNRRVELVLRPGVDNTES